MKILAGLFQLTIVIGVSITVGWLIGLSPYLAIGLGACLLSMAVFFRFTDPVGAVTKPTTSLVKDALWSTGIALGLGLMWPAIPVILTYGRVKRAGAGPDERKAYSHQEDPSRER